MNFPENFVDSMSRYLHQFKYMTEYEIEAFYEDENNQAEIDLFSRVVALQAAYYALRRSYLICPSTCENIHTELCPILEAFEKTYGYNPNKHIDF